MRRFAQAFGKPDAAGGYWSSLARGTGCALLLLLAGCGSKGFTLESAVPDHALTTGSIARDGRAGGDGTALSDEATIRNAVSSAVVDEGMAAGQGWANAATGSRGTIRRIAEARESGRVCRDFEATRESYEGIHLYRGRTCLERPGNWTVTAYDRVR